MLAGEEDKEAEFIPEEGVDGEAPALQKLREKLKKAVAEKQEYLEGWQRARADFANYKRQEAGASEGKEARIKSDLVEALLPALDSFEMALKHKPGKEIELLYKQLLGALTRLGVEQYGRPGELFDPHQHEALREEPVSEAKREHTIVSVERSGYRTGEQVIRPAQVTVGVLQK